MCDACRKIQRFIIHKPLQTGIEYVFVPLQTCLLPVTHWTLGTQVGLSCSSSWSLPSLGKRTAVSAPWAVCQQKHGCRVTLGATRKCRSWQSKVSNASIIQSHFAYFARRVSAQFFGLRRLRGQGPISFAWHVAWRTRPAAPLPRSRRGWRAHRTPRCSLASPAPTNMGNMGHVPIFRGFLQMNFIKEVIKGRSAKSAFNVWHRLQGLEWERWRASMTQWGYVVGVLNPPVWPENA